MEKLDKLYTDMFKTASRQIKTSSAWQKAMPWLAGGGLLSAGVGIPLAHRMAAQKAKEEAQKERAMTFGAGALAGLFGPTLLKRLRSATGLGISPDMGYTDEFTEF